MEHDFETVEEAGFGVPPGFEDWYYAAEFSNLLPDRLNAAILHTKAAKQFPDTTNAVLFVTEHDVGDPEVVNRCHVLFAPYQEVLDWMAKQLYIIERDGILDEDIYWKLVDPILQKLWGEATTPERMKLCEQAELGVDRIFDEEVPTLIHAILYKQISL